MIKILNNLSVKKVLKPWGYEIWYAGPHYKLPYVLKKIKINSKYSSSIQFHEKKIETLTILEGKGNLIYGQKKIDINKFKNGDYTENEITKFLNNLKKVRLKKGNTFTITPGTIHSIESVDNIIFYEASTIHVDDVFRIRDKYGRKHGKISSEHKK